MQSTLIGQGLASGIALAQNNPQNVPPFLVFIKLRGTNRDGQFNAVHESAAIAFRHLGNGIYQHDASYEMQHCIDWKVKDRFRHEKDLLLDLFENKEQHVSDESYPLFEAKEFLGFVNTYKDGLIVYDKPSEWHTIEVHVSNRIDRILNTDLSNVLDINTLFAINGLQGENTWNHLPDYQLRDQFKTVFDLEHGRSAYNLTLYMASLFFAGQPWLKVDCLSARRLLPVAFHEVICRKEAVNTMSTGEMVRTDFEE